MNFTLHVLVLLMKLTFCVLCFLWATIVGIRLLTTLIKINNNNNVTICMVHKHGKSRFKGADVSSKAYPMCIPITGKGTLALIVCRYCHYNITLTMTVHV